MHPVDGQGDPERLAARIHAAVVSDALDACGVTNRVLNAGIRPVSTVTQPIVGRAATVRSVPAHEVPEHPYATLLEGLDRLRPGEVWVVAAGGQNRSAIFGGLLATAARARGAVGCIVDGAVRDARELEMLGFPTFATGFSPADSRGREDVVEHGGAVICGGVVVRPGELVVADHDGIVVVPQELEEAVIEFSVAKLQGEDSMRRELASGLPASTAFAKYGIL